MHLCICKGSVASLELLTNAPNHGKIRHLQCKTEVLELQSMHHCIDNATKSQVNFQLVELS